MIKVVLQLLEGMGSTVAIFVCTLALSLPLGLGVAMCRMSKFKPLAWLTKIYISIMRGTPLILQIVVVYFGPYYIFRIPISLAYQFPAVIIAFTINYAAYFAEIYRGGIESISKGQYEAAQELGLSKVSTLVKIILPQMIRVAIPAVCNEAVNLVKDTALVTTLGVADLMHMTKSQVNSLSNVMPFGIAAVIYMIIIFGLTKLFAYIERKTTY